MNRCMMRILAVMLLLALVLTAAAPGEASSIPSGIAAYARLYGYEMTQEQTEACRWETGMKTMENEVFLLRSVELAYDGAVLLASANIMAKRPDVFLLPALAEPDEHVNYPTDQGGGSTWRQALSESGKKGVRVAVYPAWLDEVGAYFMEYWLEADGSLTLVSGTYMEEQGAAIRTGWHMEAYEMTAEGSSVLLDKTSEAIDLPLLAPLVPILCKITTNPSPVAEVSLVRTFFGYTPSRVQDGELFLLSPDGEFTPSLADITYLQELPAVIRLDHYAADGTVSSLEAVPIP